MARRRGTEPLRVARDARSTRFSVPAPDRLAGPLDKVHRDALAKRRVALALYRIPDHDDADDVYVAADENLPPERRPLPPTSRLDDFAYLGEAKIRLDQLLTRVRAGGGRSGERGSRHRYAIAPARARAEIPPDAPRRCPRRVQRRRRGPRRRPRAMAPPRLSRRRTIRRRFSSALLAPRIHLEPEGTRPRRPRASVSMGRGRVPARVLHARRGVGRPDGDTTRRESVQRRPLRARASGFVARMPDDARRRVAALRGGGATEEDEGPNEGVAFSGLLPREDVSWRVEFVARTRDEKDALLGWLDVTPRTLELAGRDATRENPAVFQCECARGIGDFDVVRLDPAAGDTPPVATLERWALRPGRRTGRPRSPATKVPARVREAARRAAAEEGNDETVKAEGNDDRR